MVQPGGPKHRAERDCCLSEFFHKIFVNGKPAVGVRYCEKLVEFICEDREIDEDDLVSKLGIDSGEPFYRTCAACTRFFNAVTSWLAWHTHQRYKKRSKLVVCVIRR